MPFASEEERAGERLLQKKLGRNVRRWESNEGAREKRLSAPKRREVRAFADRPTGRLSP